MKNIYSLFLVLMICTSLHAQDKTADLKTLINQSFSYFPKFKELQQTLNVEENRIELAKTSGLPQIAATGSYRYADPVSEISMNTGGQLMNLQIMPNNNYSTMLNANYTIWDFGVTKAGVERAKAGLQYAKDNLDYNQHQMAFQVGQIYYQIAYLKKAIAIQDSVINFLVVNRKDTEIKLKNGDAIKYDVLSIQSSIDQESNRRIDLQNNLNKQFTLLEYATGAKSSTNVADFSFPSSVEQDSETALSTAQNNQPEFKLIEDRIRQAEADLRVSNTDGKPSLSVHAGTGFANGYTPEIDKFRYNYTAGVSLNIPIYQGGRAKKQVKLSQSMLDQAKLTEETLANTYKKDIEQALIDIKSNTSSLTNSSRQVLEAKEAQKLAQSRFKNGIGTNLELTNASTNVQRALLTNLQYEYQLCIAQLNLAKLTGLKYWL